MNRQNFARLLVQRYKEQYPSFNETYRHAVWIIDSALAAQSVRCGYTEDVPLQAHETIYAYAERHFVYQEPLARLTHTKEFCQFDFALNSHTLEPRIESEGIVHYVLKYLCDGGAVAAHTPKGSLVPSDELNIVDIGTGSGCLIISILLLYARSQSFDALQTIHGYGIDCVYEAILQAHINSARLFERELSAKQRSLVKLSWLQGNWCDTIALESMDVMISNPPYIPSADIAHLPEAVRYYDPILALDGGSDGLSPYRALMQNFMRCLKPHGMAIVEMGSDQAAALSALAQTYFTHVDVMRDVFDRPRFIIMRYKNTLS